MGRTEATAMRRYDYSPQTEADLDEITEYFSAQRPACTFRDFLTVSRAG